MKFLVVSTNIGDVSGLIDAEFARVDELREDGTLRDGWLKSDVSGAVLILECADQDEAVATLHTLPSVIHRATEYTLTEIVDLDSVR